MPHVTVELENAVTEITVEPLLPQTAFKFWDTLVT